MSGYVTFHSQGHSQHFRKLGSSEAQFEGKKEYGCCLGVLRQSPPKKTAIHSDTFVLIPLWRYWNISLCYRSARRGRGSGGLTVGGRRDYTPVSWRKYWDSCKDVTLEGGDVFRVYQRGSEGPLLVLLHGGGYSALTWSLFAVSWPTNFINFPNTFVKIRFINFFLTWSTPTRLYFNFIM